MCQSKSKGGRRCAAHQPGTLAMVSYLAAATDLDEAQVAAVLKEVRRENSIAPQPTAEEARAVLTGFARRVEQDDTMGEETRSRVEARIESAMADLSRGEVPSGMVLASWEQGMERARAADEALSAVSARAATVMRQDKARVRAMLNQWRRNPDAYDDVPAPDPAFRYDQSAMFAPGDDLTKRALRKLGWQAYLSQPLPVFTYGTLREGQANRGRFGPSIASSQGAVCDGVAVYGPDRPFPFAKAGQGARTVGDLVHLTDDADGSFARTSLDHLEGFNSNRPGNSLYLREQRPVTITGPGGQPQTVQAWVYLATPSTQEYFAEDEIIPDGDWVAAKDAARARY